MGQRMFSLMGDFRPGHNVCSFSFTILRVVEVVVLSVLGWGRGVEDTYFSINFY